VEGTTHFIQLDATRPLPFTDAAFEWVYAEHFIEHISLKDGIAWLKEVRRVLQPGGFARITTPDLRRYAAAYLDPDGGFFAEHRERMLRAGFPAMETRKAWMVNQIFQFWGHKWIYDLDELRHAAVAAGFAPEAVHERAFREGRDAEVAALDFDMRSDETLSVELSA
jgi:predicted SAM-dependent methyltransferase